MSVSLKQGMAHYQLHLESPILMNDQIGKKFCLEFLNERACIACQRSVTKVFQQGYCFPCARSKAACDICIVRPERCHFHLGTCREPSWGQAHCMQKHVVYLANTSGLKVGITRYSNIPTRFIDQGATEALPLFEVGSRYHSGLVEVLLAQELADKTNWRKMLQGASGDVYLLEEAVQIKRKLEPVLEKFRLEYQAPLVFLEPSPFSIAYPVEVYPTKISSFSLDKTPILEDTLLGIKGQYLIFHSGVMNIRAFTGYRVRLRFFN